MKKQLYLILLKSLFVAFVLYSVSAFAQPGVLDQAFGNNGKIYIPIPLGTKAHPVDIKVQPDQKILVLVRIDTGYAGSLTVSSQFFRYQLLRFNPDGTPDNSFALNGSTPVVNNERPTSIELLANGKILLNTALFTSNLPLYPPDIDLCLTRYNANGSIDNTFGTNGRAVTRFDSSLSVAMSVFVLPNGKIIQAGVAYTPFPQPYKAHNIMVGFDQNGNIDPSFGSNGKSKIITNTSYNDYYCDCGSRELTIPQTYLMLPNQKIVAGADSGFYRFNSNGSLDATFGTNGFVYYPAGFLGIPNIVFAGLQEPNGKMVFVMRRKPFPFPFPYVQYPLVANRFNADGSLDSTFRTFVVDDDRLTYSTSGNHSGKIFLEPNGQYSLVAGVSYGGNTTVSCIAKINSDGSADSSYGKRGRVPANFRIIGNAAAGQPDGKIVAGGIIDTFIAGSGSSQKGFIISRYEKNARVRYNTLVSNVFHDENSNGIKDAGEEPFTGWYGINTIKPGRIDTLRWYSRPNSFQPDFQDVDTGTYRSSVHLYNMSYYTVVPAARTTSHSTYWNTDTLSFAVQKIANIRDLAVTVAQLNNAKPGFPIDYLLQVHNAGTDSAGNVVVKLMKSNKIVYGSATTPPASVVGDTLTWNIGGLRSQHDAFIIVHGTVKVPPAVNIGDALQAVLTVSSDKPDTLTSNDTSTIWHYVVGAYDPNDKSENHGGKIALSKAAAGEYLTYTIRFQNTGNDTAFNVYIRDTMDSKLDWSSLQIVAASHNYKMTMDDGRCLFTFPFIKLVDSLHNKPLSHGYIVYKIKAKPNVQIGDVIKNTASIYFDYNLPVKTNTETTTVVADALPVKLLSFTAKRMFSSLSFGEVRGEVLLQWSTASEINVDRFEVERSANGIEFSEIGSVKSKRENGRSSYEFTDKKPGTGNVNYYRLKMMDKDGSFTYSPTVQVKFSILNSPFSISIYPNPAKDKLQVQVSSNKKAILQLQVLSQDGKSLISQQWNVNEGTTTQTLNVASLPGGSYLLKLAADNKETNVVKFEKQ